METISNSVKPGSDVKVWEWADNYARAYCEGDDPRIIALIEREEYINDKDYAALVDGGHITMNQVPRTPSDGCYFCPAYRPEAAHDGGPGCPGQNVTAGPFPRA